MKHLKNFNEELNPSTYRKAAYRLSNYNKEKKSQALIDWADKQEFGYYNMSFVTDNTIIAKGYTFTNPKLIGMYYGSVRDNGFPVYGENVLESKDSELLANKLVNNWKVGDDLTLTFEFGFKATSLTKSRHSYLNNPSKETSRFDIGQSVPMFSIELGLSNWYDGIKEWDREYKRECEISGEEFTPTSLYDFYKESANEDLTLKRPNNKHFFGIFSDRGSAFKFLKFLKESMGDKVKEKIMDVLSIVGGNTEDLERILNSFNKVRVHGLYDNELTAGGGLSNKWFDKNIN